MQYGARARDDDIPGTCELARRARAGKRRRADDATRGRDTAAPARSCAGSGGKSPGWLPLLLAQRGRALCLEGGHAAMSDHSLAGKWYHEDLVCSRASILSFAKMVNRVLRLTVNGSAQGHGEMHSMTFGSVVFSRKSEWQQVRPGSMQTFRGCMLILGVCRWRYWRQKPSGTF